MRESATTTAQRGHRPKVPYTVHRANGINSPTLTILPKSPLAL